MNGEDLLAIARVQAAKALRQFCGIREGGLEIESYSERDDGIVYILRPTDRFGYLVKVIFDKEKKKVDTECYMIQGICRMVLPEGEWIHEPFSTSTDDIRCSVCGNMEKTWKDEEPSEFFRYCYQCGAKMDKKQIQTEKSENYIKTKEKNYDKQ